MQQIIDDNPDQIAAAVRAIGTGLVMVDGCTGAGKTRLACMVAKRIRAVAIDADCYIQPGRGFIAGLRVEAMKAAVDAVLARRKIALVSGICARDRAKKFQLTPALYVYVQRNTSVGRLAEMEIIDAEDAITHDYRPGLETEIANYHAQYQPRRNAQILYIRTEIDPLEPE